VRYVVIPAYEGTGIAGGRVHLRSSAAAFAEQWPEQLKPYYDPARDHGWNMQALGAIAGYLVMAVGICTALDLVPSLTLRLKTQGARSYFTPYEWLQAVGLSSFNMAFSSWLVTVPAWHLQRSGLLRGGTPVAQPEDPFDLRMALVHFLAHAVIIDVWFYTTHRALHWPPLYKAIHKLHHKFKAPTGVACMFAHPLEFCIGNVLGVMLGPALTNCHPISAAFWTTFALVSTSGSHSGCAPRLRRPQARASVHRPRPGARGRLLLRWREPRPPPRAL
jgi:methylsterol monooxygenase